MEPTVLSGPLGHTQWESEQPFPLGFHTVAADNGGMLCTNKTGQAGFQDFRNGDQDQASQQNEDIVFSDKQVELDSFIDVSDFTCGDVRFTRDQASLSQLSLHSAHVGESSPTEQDGGPNEISDCTLSWLFSPNLVDVVGKNPSGEELNLTQTDPLKSSDAVTSQAELISLSVPASPSKISENNTVDPFVLIDLQSNETSCLSSEPSGEINPQGVSEELVNLSQEDQSGLPPSPSRETLSPETGDKGLFPGQVTDLLVTCSTTLQGLSENCLSRDHISPSLECIEGSVPLLDLEIPDCDSSLSLCPTSPGSPLDSLLKELEAKHKGDIVKSNLTSEQGENDSLVHDVSMEPPPLTVTLAEDAFTPSDFTSESHCAENEHKDLMEDRICSEAKPQGNEGMALDLCLAADELHDEETWELTPHEDAQDGSIPDPTSEQREQERSPDTNQQEGSDSHEVASLDFSVQDLDSSASEAGWTSEQTVTISKMVVDDSLPMVSAVNTREEDVSPLKAVFDALDQDGDGFVRVEEFMEFAAAYGADQVRCFSVLLTSMLRVCIYWVTHAERSTVKNSIKLHRSK